MQNAVAARQRQHKEKEEERREGGGRKAARPPALPARQSNTGQRIEKSTALRS